MNILVTGGAGYIGSVCVEELIKLNHQVIVIDNLQEGSKGDKRCCISGWNHRITDRCKSDSFDRCRCDALSKFIPVFHHHLLRWILRLTF